MYKIRDSERERDKKINKSNKNFTQTVNTNFFYRLNALPCINESSWPQTYNSPCWVVIYITYSISREFSK